MDLLSSNDFPSIKRKKQLKYKEWVQRSFLTALFNPDIFCKEIENLLGLKTAEWFKYKLVTHEVSIPAFRLIHHFSGRLEDSDRIVCFALNPKAGPHMIHEFKRVLFMEEDYSFLQHYDLPQEKVVEKLESLGKNDYDTLASFFWEDENLRFRTIPSLIEISRKRDEHKGSQWSSYRNIFKAVLRIKGVKPSKDDNIWYQADNHLAIIDLIPYYTTTWGFPIREEIFPYFEQMLEALFLISKNTPLIFFGADYVNLFYNYLKKNREKFEWETNFNFTSKPKSNKVYSESFYLKNKKVKDLEFPLFFLPFPRIPTSDDMINKIIESIRQM
ncbi:MAG: hypothetical protein ACTSPG_06120 [Candidatus Hodarchaeales archaeon]